MLFVLYMVKPVRVRELVGGSEGVCGCVPRDPNLRVGEQEGHNTGHRALLCRDQSSLAYVQARPCAQHPH